MANLFDRAGHASATAGTGTITLGAALGAVAPNLCSFLSFANAGVADGNIVSYLILDSNGAWETGWGVYTASGTTLTRNVTKSSNSNALITLSGAEQVFICARAEDMATIAAMRAAGLQFNGSMEISQENGTNTVNPGNAGSIKYIIDGFGLAYISAGMTLIGQQSTTTSPPFGNTLPNCLLIKATVGSGTVAAGDTAQWFHQIEGYRLARAGFGAAGAQPLTIGFWVLATIAGNIAVSVRNSALNRSYVVDVAINNANTWEWKVITVPGDTTGTWLQTNGAGAFITWAAMGGSNFQTTPNVWTAANKTSTASSTNFFATTNNVVTITGVIVLIGAHQLSLEMSPLLQRSFDDDLAIAQRYYEKSYLIGVNPGTAAASNGISVFGLTPLPSAAYAPTQSVYYKVRKRTTPTVTLFSPNTGASGKAEDFTSTADVTASVGGFSGDTMFNWSATMSAAATTLSLGAQWVADARL